LQLRPLAFATFLVWWLRIGACGVGACGLLVLMTAARKRHKAFRNSLTSILNLGDRIFKEVSIDPAAPFKMCWVPCVQVTSQLIGYVRSSPYINAYLDNSNTHLFTSCCTFCCQAERSKAHKARNVP